MRWLSIDPGETTGWALWDDRELLDAGQDPLVEFRQEVAMGTRVGTYAKEAMPSAYDGPYAGIKRLVIERFALYPWVMCPKGQKSSPLAFDEVRTARLIGALEFIAYEAGLEVVFQPATIKEPALTSGAAELFQRPLHENRHANDAVMHGWYYIATTMLGQRIEVPGGSAVMIDPQELRSPDA